MRDLCFQCAESGCFGNENGWCRILTGDTNKRPCPFFKTQKQIDEEKEKSIAKFGRRKYVG